MKNTITHRFYAWLVLGLCATFLFYKYILQVSPGILTTQLMQEFHVDGMQLGNLAAIYFYTYVCVQVFAGPLLDRFSLRKVTPIAILCCALGAIIFAQAQQLDTAYIARALMGVGVAFATISYMKVAATFFKPSQFAFIGGLLTTATMSGAFFGETPLVITMHALGWRHTLILIGILGIIIAGIFFLYVKTPAHTHHNSHRAISLHDLRRVLSAKQNWLIAIYSGLAFSPLAVLGGLWGNPFLETAYHLPLTQASFVLSFVFIGLAFGGPILGWLSDRWQIRRPIMMTGALLSFFTLTPIIYYPHLLVWQIALLLFVFGFATGAFMLGFVLAKEANALLVAATVIAMVNTGCEIFGAVTEPLVGKFLDLGWNGVMQNGARIFSLSNYQHAFLLLPCYLIMAFILLFFVRE